MSYNKMTSFEDVQELILYLESEFECVKCEMGYTNGMAILDHIQSHGLSASVESLMGVSFSDEVEAIEGVMDVIKEKSRRVWEFIKKMISHAKAFLTKHFGKFKGYARALKKFIDKVDSNEYQYVFEDKSGKPLRVSRETFDFATLTSLTSVDVLTLHLDVDEFDALLNENVKHVLYDLTWSGDGSKDDPYDYDLTDHTPDLVQSDRLLSDIIGFTPKGRTPNAKELNQLGLVKVAALYLYDLCNKLKSGKMIEKVQQKFNKISQKVDRAAKKGDYDEESVLYAKNIRLSMTVNNKITMIKLKAIKYAVASVLAMKLEKK